MSLARRIMEPKHWSDRLLYALQTILIPGSAAVLTREGFGVSAIIMIAFWVMFSFYTIEWLAEWLLKKRAR